MSRRLPRTSYGYLPPPGALATGWSCPGAKCGRRDRPAPGSWPFRCPRCGTPTDPILAEPWAHEAEGCRLRHELAAEYDGDQRPFEEISLRIWEYKDARLRGDRAGEEAALQECRRLDRADGDLPDFIPFGASQFIRAASDVGDIDRAAEEVLKLYPRINTTDVEENGIRRAAVREFLSLCVNVLEQEASIGHPRETELDTAMRDVARRGADAVNPDQERGFQRVGEIRALHGARSAIARARRTVAAAIEDLPHLADHGPARGFESAAAAENFASLLGARPQSAYALADAAVYAAQVQGDTGLLDSLVRQAELLGTAPALTCYLRARRRVAVGDLSGALRDLDAAVSAVRRGDDATDARLLPRIHATKGLLSICEDPKSPDQLDPASLDVGIRECQTARQLGLRRLRRASVADVLLGRLLLWRSLQPGASARQQAADAEAALRLARRHCRSARVALRPSGVGGHLLLQEALAARATLTGRGDPWRLHADWSRLVEAPHPAPDRARLAAAWAQWAVGTGVAELTADAYERLVATVAEDCAARYGAQAKQRVLAAAQEYTEEAGYWLARTGRYRQAVLALETGRAVTLTEVLGRDSRDLLDRLNAAGHADLAEAYRRALAAYEDGARRALPDQKQGLDQERGRAWEELRGAARRVATVIGTDPLASVARYEEVTAQTRDGALVYLAAAKASGYALIIAAHHEPQFVELPKLDRAAVAVLVNRLIPAPTTLASPAPIGAGDGERAESGAAQACATRPRDADSRHQTVGPAAVLRALWDSGLADLLVFHARGPILTLIPVGLLSLLPLHAAGDPDAVADPDGPERHAGQFSAIRYAPNARALDSCRRTAGLFTARDASLLAVDVPDGAGLPHGLRLEYVARETREAVHRWPTRAARRIPDCTWEQFGAAAADYAVWHLACHAEVDPRSILDSTLCFKDRRVSLDELRGTLRRGPRRLAVLSACRTNATDAAVPNELVGLPSALLQTGFAGVVASAWPVDDLATAYLMTVFYFFWCSQGDHPAVALNRAQRFVRAATRENLRTLMPDVEPRGDAGDRPYRNPRFWAAFAYTGA